jgi:sn-glycerol 3-phosphate transport system substrate-binding protein
MEGLDAELMINSELHVRHIQNLIDMQAEGSFTYGGRDSAADAIFPSGECAILHGSSGLRGRVLREAEFDWSDPHAALLRRRPGRAAQLDHRRGELLGHDRPRPHRRRVRRVAEFFNFISSVEMRAAGTSSPASCRSASASSRSSRPRATTRRTPAPTSPTCS